MAQQTTVRFVDDLDGSEASGTVSFSFDGRSYEIDLSEKNAERFRNALKEFIDASREFEQAPVLTFAPARSSRRQSAGSSGRDDIAQIRSWAEAQGMEVNARGRIKKEIIEAYDAAHC
jgi:uncharacterized membrane protein